MAIAKAKNAAETSNESDLATPAETSNEAKFTNAAKNVANCISAVAFFDRALATARADKRAATKLLKTAKNEFADAQNALLGKPPRKPRKPRAPKVDAAAVVEVDTAAVVEVAV